MVTITRRNWKRGTTMRLKSPDTLSAFVVNATDRERARQGHPINPRKVGLRDLARRVEVHPSFIGQLVNGTRNGADPVIAARIADHLDMPLEALFDINSPSRPTPRAPSVNIRSAAA